MCAPPCSNGGVKALGPPSRRPTAALALTVLLVAASSCAHPPAAGTELVRRGDEISVCGQLFHTETPVVLWNDPGGYDAYRLEKRFSSGDDEESSKARYGSMRRNLPPELDERVRRSGWRLEDLQDVVRLFVLHYDATGTSRGCFKVLHDVRGLSVHFLLDVDGTIYQTLDLKERAWHAGTANDASIGIEIAHIGAYDSPDASQLRDWYRVSGGETRINFPDYVGDPGQRKTGYIPKPARPELLQGEIHGVTYYQYDFTEEQYEALGKLTAALTTIFPKMRLAAPTDAEGQVRTDVLSKAELARFGGIVGHWHITTNKRDPGPAFDWDRLFEEAPRHY